MTFEELRKLKRGEFVDHKGSRQRVLYAATTERGGVGMGEYPAIAVAVLCNGVVLRCDEWVDKVEASPPMKGV